MQTLSKLNRTFFLAAILALAAPLLAPLTAAAQQAPDALVKAAAEEVLAIVKADPDIRAGNLNKAQAVIQQKLVPHFDFQRMTALAMGRNWRNATPEQQQRLMDEFRTLLVRTYSGALANYRDEKFDYKPLRMQPTDTDVMVRTAVIRQGGQPIPIDYGMAKSGDTWKAYDVVVGGVSLVTNYREEFSSTIRDSGIDGLIKTLAEKNKSNAAK